MWWSLSPKYFNILVQQLEKIYKFIFNFSIVSSVQFRVQLKIILMIGWEFWVQQCAQFSPVPSGSSSSLDEIAVSVTMPHRNHPKLSDITAIILLHSQVLWARSSGREKWVQLLSEVSAGKLRDRRRGIISHVWCPHWPVWRLTLAISWNVTYTWPLQVAWHICLLWLL